MIFEKKEGKLIKSPDIWDVKELELENLITSIVEVDTKIINEDIFGEELLFLKKQVRTNSKKRADILALDRNGSAVIIELKKERGRLGVDTQALQYLADFSNYIGDDFISKFCDGVDIEDIESFLYNDITLNDLNRHSRIILVARYFDPTLFSMGKWFADNGVSFRCVSYTPLKIEYREYISFSVVFDQLSINSIYKIRFENEQRSPKKFWHVENIETHMKDPDESNKSWNYLINNKLITTSFDNAEGDRGEMVLRKYIKGDEIFAYMSGYGLIGYGVISNPKTYKLVRKGSKEDVFNGFHLHRLHCDWKYVIKDVNKAITSKELKEKYNIHHPIMTSSEIKAGKVKKLIEDLKNIT